MRPGIIWRGFLAFLLVLTIVPSVRAQEPDDDPVQEAIEEMMGQMSPRLKVGQLMLASFPGTEVGNSSMINTLIRDYGIGGVIIRPANGNFGTTPISPTAFISMTNDVQQAAWDASIIFNSPAVDDVQITRPYIPLLTAVDFMEDGLPITAFVAGTTNIPTPLAVGATWSRPLAEASGQVLGHKLAGLGVNMVLGPNLDVLYMPRPGDSSDLGVTVFGGDPFWVGELGRSYVRGLQQGSDNKLLVVPTHFPGLGGADRLVEEEVPTVQRVLEQLKLIDLAPFFSVTAGVPGESGVVDGLLVSHIRYRGLQSNIRLSTRPISLDAQALQQVISLKEIVPWREEGGVLVAQNLGLKSVHLSYDPLGLSFNARRVVQEALVAGNDLLILDRFAADNDDWDAHFANIQDVLDFMAQRYESDPTFQSMVDAAVARVLRLKLRLYPDFSPDTVFAPDLTLPSATATVEATESGRSNVNAETATNALTRLFPFSEDLLPAPPEAGERIVIFTQEQKVQVREDAESFVTFSQDIVPQALLRFYGPDGTGVVSPSSLSWFSFEDLQTVLAPVPPVIGGDETASGTPTPIPVTPAAIVAVNNADWIIFALTAWNTADPAVGLLKEFLAEQTGVLDAQVAVLSFGPPYGLDSTEISKVDLYYALYAPGAAFAEVGVRALFRGLSSHGALPVSVPALNYELTRALMPDANQIISLALVGEDGETLDTETLGDIRSGYTVVLRTSVIIDSNGHPVPDGTPVQFTLSYPQENISRNISSVTKDGIASISVTLDRVGQLDITVQSEPAPPSFRLQLTIREDEPATIVYITPTPPPPTPNMPTPTPVVDPYKQEALPDPIQLPLPDRGSLLQWGLASITFTIFLGFIWARERHLQAVLAVRLALLGGIGAVLSYIGLLSVMYWGASVTRYQLAGREFLSGGVAFLGGVTALVIAFIIVRLEQVKKPVRGNSITD
ncbi:MAG: hypothetical protein JW981_06855 [Anaerolineae bacterium]|nr:hypothetical protein [Anaerolineae bacterium]